MLSAYLRDRIEKRGWLAAPVAFLPAPRVLIVSRSGALPKARATHPGLVAYGLRELELLHVIRRQRARLADIHRVKKIFGGWVRQITHSPTENAARKVKRFMDTGRRPGV